MIHEACRTETVLVDHPREVYNNVANLQHLVMVPKIVTEKSVCVDYTTELQRRLQRCIMNMLCMNRMDVMENGFNTGSSLSMQALFTLFHFNVV